MRPCFTIRGTGGTGRVVCLPYGRIPRKTSGERLSTQHPHTFAFFQLTPFFPCRRHQLRLQSTCHRPGVISCCSLAWSLPSTDLHSIGQPSPHFFDVCRADIFPHQVRLTLSPLHHTFATPSSSPAACSRRLLECRSVASPWPAVFCPSSPASLVSRRLRDAFFRAEDCKEALAVPDGSVRLPNLLLATVHHLINYRNPGQAP